MAATQGQEPRFSLPDSTPRSSKTSLVISGIRAYIYGLDEVLNAHESGSEGKPQVACLFLAHARTRTYRVTEGVAHELLWRYREGIVGFNGEKETPGSIPLIAVTFDMRNHGAREISKEANLTWKDGNENHAFDIMSLINGAGQDLHLLIKFLPCYLPNVSITRNYVFGISLGSHSSWRLTRLLGDNMSPAVSGMALVVGSPDLSGLLLSRLGIDLPSLRKSAGVEKTYQIPYHNLYEVMSESQRHRWPEPLHRLICEDDRYLDESLPISSGKVKGMNMLLQNGKEDKLVPYKYTESWVAERGGQQNHRSDGLWFVVQDNTGHSCTKEMVARVANWLREPATQTP